MYCKVMADRTYYSGNCTTTKVNSSLQNLKRNYSVGLICVVCMELICIPKTIWFSQLNQELHNFVDVLLDAVFFPKCVEDIQIFRQQGWRYDLNDPSEDLTYQGWTFDACAQFLSVFFFGLHCVGYILCFLIDYEFRQFPSMKLMCHFIVK